MRTHFGAVLDALSRYEAELTESAMAELSAEERAAWLAKLAQLSIGDAVEEVRRAIARAPDPESGYGDERDAGL